MGGTTFFQRNSIEALRLGAKPHVPLPLRRSFLFHAKAQSRKTKAGIAWQMVGFPCGVSLHC